MGQSVDDVIEELCLWCLILLGGHGATRFSDRFFNTLFVDGFRLADLEYVGHALFHRDGHDITHILLMDNLIQFAHVHGVKNFLEDRDLAWWWNAHALLLIHCNISILFRVDAINAKWVVFCVVLERIDLESCGKSFILNFSDSDAFLLNFSVASSCNIVTDWQ